KEINDTLGHIVGDQLLCQVAERLTRALDRRGHVARFGGDEFVLICPGVSRIQAEVIAGDITRILAGDFEVGGHHLTIS
ncbi:GGDEF domain-containing protein, partial [Bacillus cereus]